MGERLVIVIEYDAGPDWQQALNDAMEQITKGLDRLDPDHIEAVQVHAAIKESADQVLAVFNEDTDR